MARDIASTSSITTRIRSGEESNTCPIKAERNLMAAVLGRAILDLYGDAAIDRLTRAGARHWLYGPIDEDREFSFGWVAKQLDLDPIIIQTQLRTYSTDTETMLKCLHFLR